MRDHWCAGQREPARAVPLEWKTMCAVAGAVMALVFISQRWPTSNSFQIWQLNYPDHQAHRVTNDQITMKRSVSQQLLKHWLMQTDVR